MASSSCCCSLVVRSDRDGQSMLLTVATHTPRNSRMIGGGVIESGTTGLCAAATSGSARAASNRMLPRRGVQGVLRGSDERRLGVERGGNARELGVGFVPPTLLDRLASRGHGLHAI